MAVTTTTAYAADIVKAERDADNNLIVYGKATGPEVDLDEQICDPDWLRTAMPQWAKWGNIREMHQPIVAGVGLETAEDDNQWYVKSQVVDEGTAKKIEAGALKGYSVGIKNPRVVKDAAAPGGRIVGGDIVEISYVDRPCNPTATLVLAKAAGDGLAPVEAKAVNDQGAKDEAPDIDMAEHVLQILAQLIRSEASEMAVGEFDETYDIQLLLDAASTIQCFIRRERRDYGMESDYDASGLSTAYLAAEADITKRKISASRRQELAKEGKALSDGSYPIENAGDLHNAYLLARSGHGDVAAAKKLIARRAKELGVDNPFNNDTSSKDAEPDEVKTSEETPLSKDEVNDLVKSAVADANKAHEEVIGELRAELQKLKDTPVPGGPVLTVPPSMRAKRMEVADAEELARLNRLAETVTDPELSNYYRSKLADFKAKHASA
jgi:hypothetical protein